MSDETFNHDALDGAASATVSPALPSIEVLTAPDVYVVANGSLLHGEPGELPRTYKPGDAFTSQDREAVAELLRLGVIARPGDLLKPQQINDVLSELAASKQREAELQAMLAELQRSQSAATEKIAKQNAVK